MLESPPNSLDESLESPDGGRYRDSESGSDNVTTFTVAEIPTPLLTSGLTPSRVGAGGGMFGFSSYEYGKRMGRLLEGASGQHRESIQLSIDEKKEARVSRIFFILKPSMCMKPLEHVWLRTEWFGLKNHTY